MRMRKENFEAALMIAIEQQEIRDAAAGITQSIFAAGLLQVLEASRRGEHITIEPN